jgi:hypothetical protein
VLDVGELGVDIVGGILGAVLGHLALAPDFAHELQSGLKLLGRYLTELHFKLFGPPMRNPHVVGGSNA